jgi:hypothetical protein
VAQLVEALRFPIVSLEFLIDIIQEDEEEDVRS